MPVFSLTGENDGRRKASDIQRRPQPRRITVGDFVPTAVANRFGTLEGENKQSKKRPAKPAEPKDILKTTYEVEVPKGTTQTTPSLDVMTLDELDRVIKEEEARFASIMNNEAGTAVVGSSVARTLPSQGEATYRYPHDTTMTKGATIVGNSSGGTDGADGADEERIRRSHAGVLAAGATIRAPMIPSSGVPTSKTASRLAAYSEEWPLLCGECNV